jgi:large subunit ribosomal protein L25
MPEIISLNAEPRPSAGKGAARATRRSGRVPGIVYGDKKEPVLISLEPRALARIVARPGFFATLVDVSVDGTTHRTLPRDVQYDPISDAPLHVDFMRVGAGAQVTVTVPVEFINHERSVGLRRGGILNIVRHGVEMICSVDNIPERVVVNLAGLDIGDSIHSGSGAVAMPPGARPVIQGREFTIASIAASSAVKEEAAQAAAAAAVAAAAPPVEEPAPAAGPPPTPGAPVTPSA